MQSVNDVNHQTRLEVYYQTNGYTLNGNQDRTKRKLQLSCDNSV